MSTHFNNFIMVRHHFCRCCIFDTILNCFEQKLVQKRIISWLYSGVLYIWYCTSHICFNIWRIIEALLYEQKQTGTSFPNNSTKMV